MTIKAGERMPEGKFKTMGEKGPKDLSTAELFGDKRVVLFSVPGAFTPTCDAKHLPGYVGLADQLRAKGVQTIACMAVNDVFVMNAWGKQSGVGDKVLMLADGTGEGHARARWGWSWMRRGSAWACAASVSPSWSTRASPPMSTSRLRGSSKGVGGRARTGTAVAASAHIR